MPRFRLRTLLVITALSACYFAVGAKTGYPAATAVALAIAAIVWAIRSPWRGCGLLLRIPALLVGSTAFWIAGIDGRWAIEECPECRWSRDTYEYRVLGMATYTDVSEGWSALAFALRDLGFPCEHPKLNSWVKHRYWGGAYCAYPCLNGSGTGGYNTNTNYTIEVSARVKAIGGSRPEFGKELYERVVLREDYDYFWQGFMLDQMVLGAYDAGNAQEARDWLAEAPPALKENTLQRRSEWSAAYFQELYDRGVTEVVIYWVYEQRPLSKPEDAWVQMVVRLPTDPTKRTEIIDAISERYLDEGYLTGLRDYGQLFAKP